MAAGQTQALLIYGTNPVFTAPSHLPFAESMSKVPFKVAFVTHMDETAGQCDLILPLLSALEDFGTHVAEYQPNGVEVMLQQPLMEKLYPESKGYGDILLEVLKNANPRPMQRSLTITVISKPPWSRPNRFSRSVTAMIISGKTLCAMVLSSGTENPRLWRPSYRP